MANIYTIEVTDTFGGEANYCWVRRYAVRASSVRGAMSVLSRLTGGHYRKAWDDGECCRYNMAGACACAFISHDEYFPADGFRFAPLNFA